MAPAMNDFARGEVIDLVSDEELDVEPPPKLPKVDANDSGPGPATDSDGEGDSEETDEAVRELIEALAKDMGVSYEE